MKNLLPCLALILISLFGVAAAAQDNPAGPAKPKVEEPKPKIEEPKKVDSALFTKWDVVISAPGQDYAGTLKIEKVGDVYKGSVTTELGEAPLGGIKIDGDSFTSTIVVHAQGQVIEGTMSGKAKDGKISGDMNLSGLGTIPYTGKKP